MRTSQLLVTAGDAALQRGDIPVSRTQLERALELAPDDRSRAVPLVRLAGVAVTGGRGEHDLQVALERLDAALRLIDAGDAVLRGDALGWRSRICWLLGRWDEAKEAADEAVAVLSGLPESPQLARVLARRSQLAMLRDEDGASELGREALAVANRVGDRFAQANIRVNLLTLDAMRGIPPDPGELLELIDEARAAGALEEAYRAQVNFIWSATGHLPVAEIEQTAAAAAVRLAGVTPPVVLNPYVDLSMVMMQLLPAGRWQEVEQILDGIDGRELSPTNLLVWLGVTSQLALRRGDLELAGERAHKQRLIAVESKEPQRIIPMSCALIPWAALTGERHELRAVAQEVLELVRDRWSSVISVLPAVRALDAAGEPELLRRWTGSLGRGLSRATAGRVPTSHTAALGLLALHEGRPDEAVELLTAASATERRLGYEFDASALDLDLARALDAAGDPARAAKLRGEAEAFMASIGCVNPI